MELNHQQRQRVESIFHDLLALPENDRTTQLEKLCPEDDSVRREVQSLLAHYRQQDPLLDQTPVVWAASGGTAVAMQPALREGECLGRYEILSSIGRGGMGEVYLARDPHLGRKVAIKILPAHLSKRPELIERLRREATAASALNHPNILTIYEFGQHGGTHFMVTEYVEGVSLRERIGCISLQQALSYARQAAEALAAAHSAGIVHRDVKPDNVMVRPDGYIKLVDFGLMKLNLTDSNTGKSLVERIGNRDSATISGLLIGTVEYMSPEQVRGQKTDARTDIWSWGVMLFELISGYRPFHAEAVPEVFSNILHKEPNLPSNNSQLKQLLARALAKDPEKRYAKMAECLADLGRIEQKTGSAIKFAPVQQHDARLKHILALLIFVISLGVFGVYRYQNTRFPELRLVDAAWITNTGRVAKAAISPDGNYVAYVSTEAEGQSLRIKQIGTTAEVRKLVSLQEKITGLTVTKNFIYYVMQKGSIGRLYRTPLLGDDVKLIAEDVDSDVSFAPDEKYFVFLRLKSSTMTSSLVIHDITSGEERILATAAGHRHLWSSPLWSRDGNLVISEVYEDTLGNMSLLAVRVADGRAEAIPVGPWSFIRKPTWLSDKALILAAASPHMNRTHLIEVRLPDGQSHDIAGGLSDYLDLSVSQSGGRLVAVEQQRFSSVWITKLKSPEKSKQLTDAGSHYYGLSWAPDGKLFTQSEAAGRSDLVMIDERSGLAKSLTDDDSVKAFPEVSGDGKYLIYSSNRDGTFHLWRSDPDGRNPVRLTTDNFGEEEGVTTPDGNWVVFTSLRSGQRSLWKVPIGGGQPISITNSLSSKPAVSPDGKLIACEYVDSKTNTLQVAILRFRDGSLIRILHQVPALTGARLRWSRDGKSVYFVMNQNGIGNIWEQEINGGPAKQLTHYQEDEIFYIAVAPDGRSIACLRGKRISDAVLANIKTN